MKKIALLLLTAVALASCKSTGGVQEMKMEKNQSFSACEGSWNLVMFMKDGIAQSIGMTDITFAADGAVSGSLGENRFRGAVASDKAGEIHALNFGSTKMAVPPELAEFENSFSTFFVGIDSFALGKISGASALELRNTKANSCARFIRNSIFYSKWTLAAVNDGNAVVNVSSDASMTIESNSVAAIFTGLNQLQSAATISETKGAISFADGPMTLVSGDEEKMKVEAILLRNLFKATRYSISGGTLSLYSGDTLLLEFRRQELVSLGKKGISINAR